MVGSDGQPGGKGAPHGATDNMYYDLKYVLTATMEMGRKYPGDPLAMYRDQTRDFELKKHAASGGTPGDGGGAGDFGVSLAYLAGLAQRQGGAPGAPTAAVSGAKVHKNWHNEIRKIKSKKSRTEIRRLMPRGAGKSYPSAAGNRGPVSEPLSLDYLGGDAWAVAAVLQAQLDRLEDLYLVGAMQQAVELATALLNWTAAVEHDEASSDYAWSVQYARLLDIGERMLGGLDFFGNPSGWVPNLSLQVNYKVYQQEIRNQVQTLFVGHWLERYWQHQSARIQAVERMVESQRQRIEDQRRVISDMRTLIPEIRGRSEEIDEQISTFTRGLDARKSQIKAKLDAEREADRLFEAVFAGLDGAVGMGLLVSMVGGVGGADPAAANKQAAVRGSARSSGSAGSGSAGSAGKAARGASGAMPGAGMLVGGVLVLGAGIAEGIQHYNANKPAEISGSEGADAFRGILEDEKVEQARQELAELGINDVGGVERYHQRITGIAEVISTEMRTAIQEDIYAALENSPDYDAAVTLQGKLEADAGYRSLFNELVTLATRRQIYADELVYAGNTLDAATNAIMEATWVIESLEKSLASHRPDPAVQDAIASMRKRAQQRLTEYQYYLAKAYEYAVLEPARVNFHNNRVFAELQKLFDIESEEGNEDDPLARAPFGVEAERLRDDLSAVYGETLRQMTSRILAGLNSERFSPLPPKDYSIELSAAQLETLNTDGRITIDLKQHGVLAPTDKNARVLAMHIDPDKSRLSLLQRPDQGVSPAVDFVIGPDEHSYIPWGEGAIGFNHREPKFSSILFWHDVWQYPDGFSLADPADQTGSHSLIATLIDNRDDPSQLHFKPSAHGTFTLFMENLTPGHALNVDELVLSVRIEKNKKIGS